MASEITIFLKFVSFFGVLWSCKAFFDVDELNSINYGIELIPKPVLLGEVGSGAHHVLLSTKHGQQYQCSFQDKNVQAEKENKEEQTAKETGIPELLKPLEDGPCLLANKGWWTYEFCYGKQITQYHMEDGKILGRTLILGVYLSEYDWNKQDEQAKKERLRRYHSQQYSNGTACDLTNSPRRAEVRFVCDDSTGDFISTIDEPESCVYEITVHTPRICHHPYLKPERTSKPVPITCHPALQQREWDVYTRQQEEAKRKEQEKIDAAKQRASLLEEAEKAAYDKLSSLKPEVLEDLLDYVNDGEEDKLVNRFKETMAGVIRMRLESASDKSTRQQKQAQYRKLTGKRFGKDGKVLVYEEGEEDDDEAELLKEFDEGLAEIAQDPQRRKILPTLRDHLKQTMTREFTGILKEAQAELLAEGQEALVDEQAALANLAETLALLLDKLDRSSTEANDEKVAEKDIDHVVKESSEKAHSAREKLMNKLMMDKNLEKYMNEDKKEKEPNLEVKVEFEDKEEESEKKDEEPTVTTEEKTSATTGGAAPAEKAEKAVDESEPLLKFDQEGENLEVGQRRVLETQVKEELKKAGLDTRGQKIQVKIISGLNKDDKLTDDDSQTFKRMVVAILGRNADEDAASDREDTMTSAYNYRWRPEQPAAQEEEQK